MSCLPACVDIVIHEAPDAEGDDPGECVDDVDNDQDGLFDCNDPDCAGSQACSGDDDDSSRDDDDSSEDTPAQGLGVFPRSVEFHLDADVRRFCDHFDSIAGKRRP